MVELSIITIRVRPGAYELLIDMPFDLPLSQGRVEYHRDIRFAGGISFCRNLRGVSPVPARRSLPSICSSKYVFEPLAVNSVFRVSWYTPGQIGLFLSLIHLPVLGIGVASFCGEFFGGDAGSERLVGSFSVNNFKNCRTNL